MNALVRRTAALAAACFGLAACAGVPTSGPIQQGPVVAAAGQDQFIRVIARPPSDGMTPEEVVAGFQEATASADAGYFVARQYLTPLASTTWEPSAGVEVYDSSGLSTSSKDGQVLEDGTLTATLDAAGQYSVAPPGTHRTWTYSMEQVKGQWRISEPPAGLVLGPGDIDRSYRSFDLYYFTRDFATLVPAPVTIPLSDAGLATSLVRGLLDGPTSWIAPAVRSAFPEGTRLALDSVPVIDGVAEVALTREVLSADDDARQKLSAQLVWTLRQVPGVSAVNMTVNGQTLSVPGVAAVQPIDSWSLVAPDVLSDTARAYAVAKKSLVQIGLDGALTGAARTRPAIILPGISLDSTRVAGLSVDHRTLYVGKLVDGVLTKRYVGTDLARPTWDPAGLVWTVDRGTGLVLVRPTSAAPIAVTNPPPGFSARDITAVSMSRDGTRLAMLVRRGTLVEPWVARVERSGATVTVAAPRRVANTVTEALDLSWLDAETLAVLGTSGQTSLEVLEFAVGSSRVRHTAAPDSTATTLAAAPGRVLLVGEAGAVWRSTGPSWARIPDVTDPAYPG
jgi:Lipoprotein LpqB beta-propeller domain/Sporulation and spore germination